MRIAAPLPVGRRVAARLPYMGRKIGRSTHLVEAGDTDHLHCYTKYMLLTFPVTGAKVRRWHFLRESPKDAYVDGYA